MPRITSWQLENGGVKCFIFRVSLCPIYYWSHFLLPLSVEWHPLGDFCLLDGTCSLCHICRSLDSIIGTLTLSCYQTADLVAAQNLLFLQSCREDFQIAPLDVEIAFHMWASTHTLLDAAGLAVHLHAMDYSLVASHVLAKLHPDMLKELHTNPRWKLTLLLIVAPVQTYPGSGHAQEALQKALQVVKFLPSVVAPANHP